MTQKEALYSLLSNYSNIESRYRLVLDWLEDINWHTEHSMLAGLIPERSEKLMVNLARGDENLAIGAVKEYQLAGVEYHVFSRIFGFGLKNDGWDTKGSGMEFVKELEGMIIMCDFPY